MYASTLSACVEDYGGVEDCNSLQHTTAQRTVTSVVELGVVESGYKEGERERGFPLLAAQRAARKLPGES